jgi:hypothetical protein
MIIIVVVVVSHHYFTFLCNDNSYILKFLSSNKIKSTCLDQAQMAINPSQGQA